MKNILFLTISAMLVGFSALIIKTLIDVYIYGRAYIYDSVHPAFVICEIVLVFIVMLLAVFGTIYCVRREIIHKKF